MKIKRKAFLSFVISLVLFCSFILPAFAASYQNGDKVRISISEVEAFHGGRAPAKPGLPTAATGETITTTACIGMRAIASTSCKS